MQKKDSTPSCVYEFKLLETEKEHTKLIKLQGLARILYNACLGEALKRLKLIKQDKLYTRQLKVYILKKPEEIPFFRLLPALL